jgi:CAAX prenyl protease-like protein
LATADGVISETRSGNRLGVSMTNLWLGAAGLIFCAIVFAWHCWLRDPVSRWLTPYTGLQHILPLRAAEFVVRIPLYGVPGLVAYSLLSWLWPQLVIPMDPSWEGALAGFVLGGGLMLFGSALANGAFMIALSIQGGRAAQRAGAELAAAKDSGWMRGYMVAYRELPVTLFIGLAAVSVAGEELMFRGVMLPLLVRGFGLETGFALTLLAFVVIQKVFMPSWQAATIPMSAALVCGLVLGYIALVRQDMFVVIVSHVSFYVVNVLVLLSGEDDHRRQEPRRSGQRRKGLVRGMQVFNDPLTGGTDSGNIDADVGRASTG